MRWNDGSWGAGNWLAMTLMMVLFWGALVVLVVWLVRTNRQVAARPSGGLPDVSHRPVDVLAERFARGEIDEDEFRRRRDVLHSPPNPSQRPKD